MWNRIGRPARVRGDVRVSDFGGFLAVLEDPNVQAVLLAMSHSLHAEQIERAAKAGKHVFCEKPLALTRAGAERSVQLMASQGLVLGIGHERRWSRRSRSCWRKLRAGKLGKLLQMEANSSHDKFTDARGRQLAIIRRRGARGRDDSHRDSLVRHGDVAVRGGRDGLRKQRDFGEQDPQWRFELRPRAIPQRLHGVCFGDPGDALFISRIALFGSEGWIEVRDKAHVEAFQGSWLTRCAKGGEPATTDIPVAKPVLANLEAFARAVQGDAPYPISTADMIANAAVMEAIFKSAKEGTAQKIPRESPISNPHSE